MRYFGFSELNWDFDEPIATTRRCEHPGCDRSGEFRAPKSPREPSGHYWFCLDHVRAYNASWDFFAGMDQGEIEAFQRDDVTWHRPTWRLGVNTKGGGPFGGTYRDPLGVFADEPSAKPETRTKPARWRSGPERRALEQLELDGHATSDDIKVRYKELVKRYHPDTNGGSKDAEERLKAINQAYSLLRKRAAPSP